MKESAHGVNATGRREVVRTRRIDSGVFTFDARLGRHSAENSARFPV
ncbi:hypothetical protein [Burkholderia dolosa]|nr:hypothetical protein [Burkholderia dolosa]MCC5028411.1 hypothetical protein [Burkholderia dolosa]